MTLSTNLSVNCYGESLDSTPDFFMAKKAYEESLVDWNEEDISYTQLLEINEHIPNFDTPLKKKHLLKTVNNNEENILRNHVEPLGTRGDTTKMV
jgi:hypothetical protein